MLYATFVSSFFFVVFLVWYVATENQRQRRWLGLAAIVASLVTCGLSLHPLEKTIKLGLDLKGGTSFLVELEGMPSRDALEQAVGVIRKRLDPTGTRELIIQPVGDNRISVQIPGLAEADKSEARNKLSRVAKLDFRMVHPQNQSLAMQAIANHNKLPVSDAIEYEALPMTERDAQGKSMQVPIVVSRASEMSGKHVKRAFATLDSLGRPEVALEFDSEGSEIFAELTERAIGQRIAIVLDQEVRSAPRVNQRITGNAVITGSMNQQEAQELASILENPLETPVKIVEERGIDPSLGQDSIQSGRNSGLVALAGVIVFMVVYYHISGVVSVVALLANLVLLLGMLAQFHFTLTLPGIAGIVLTIGMAVDANVLIYERIRDELTLGKPLRQAIDTGFERAFSAIFDSNVTTLIPAVVLMFLGTGPLRGFAVTLTLGIVANLFAALVISRNVFDWLLAWKHISTLSMLRFLTNPQFDFLRYRRVAVTASLALLLGGAVAFYYHGKDLFGVDFNGGDALCLKYEKQVPVGDVRAALIKNDIRESMVQYAVEAKQLLIQTKVGEGEKAEKLIAQAFPDAGFTHGSLDSVGPQVGGELQQKALLALGLGILGILIYAAIRFEWSFAVAAAIGQLHDVLVALGIMAILGREINLTLVGAFLTIAGYSINDKIVVFDRIREGVRLREKGTFYESINRSMNLTLARTLLTGMSMIIAVSALIIFGGPVIHDFSVAMLIGIFSGIYSSHFISPPLAWWLDSYKDQNRHRNAVAAQPA